MDDVAVLQYTGGTTGLSKGAVLTHRNLSINVQQIDAWFTGVRPGEEVVLCALPMFHVFGMTVAMNWGVWAGAKIVLMPNPRDLPELVKLVVKERVTLFPGVPALFNGLNNQPGIDQADVSSVKYWITHLSLNYSILGVQNQYHGNLTYRGESNRIAILVES